MWPDSRVVALVDSEFLAARLHIKEQAADFRRFGDRYGAQWTPTILMLDHEGTERHRVEGYLPVDDFLAQLSLGLGQIAFHAGRFDDAASRFGSVVDAYPATDAAPEAQYWAGVSRYKATGDGSHLAATARAFGERYQNSIWAKKASVWGGH